MSGGADYNSQLMSSLHKQGGKGNVNTTLFGGRDQDFVSKLFGHGQDNKQILGGDKSFSTGGEGGNAVFHVGDPKSFDSYNNQKQAFESLQKNGQNFSTGGRESTFSLAGASTTMSTGSYMMNPMVQQAGMGMMGLQQMMSIRPNSGVQGGFLGYSGFGGIAGNAPMHMGGTMNFPSFGISNANFSTGGSGGGSSAAMANSGGGSSHSMGMPSFAGVSFGGDVSHASLGQFSAKASAPMNMSLFGDSGPSLG